MEVRLGHYREKTSCSLWKRVGGSVLYAWGKAIYCRWGRGTDYYCAMGSTAYRSLGKETRTARQVLAERILRMRHVLLDLPSVSNCPGPPTSPQGSECTQSAKGAASSETLHVSDPMSPLTYTFPPSLISLVPSRLNTSMRHSSYLSDCYRYPLFGPASCTGCAAAGDSQLFTGWKSVNFDNSIELWMSELQNSCLMCSDKVRELLMIFKKIKGNVTMF